MPSCYFEGYFYGIYYRNNKYDPSKLEPGVMKSNFFFEGGDKSRLNDCLPHAVNFLLRFPYFESRE